MPLPPGSFKTTKLRQQANIVQSQPLSAWCPLKGRTY